MSPLTAFILTRIFRRLFVQSSIHRANLVGVYDLVRVALEREFTEDTYPGLECFSQECHTDAWKVAR